MRHLIKIVFYCVLSLFCSTAYADGLIQSDQSINGWQLMAHPTNKTCFAQFTGNDFRVRRGLIGESGRYSSYLAFFGPDHGFDRTVVLTSAGSGDVIQLTAKDFIYENDLMSDPVGLLIVDYPSSLSGEYTVSMVGGDFTVNFADLSSLGASISACQKNNF